MDNVTAVKCACGNSHCTKWGLSDGDFYQGCGWDEETARRHAAAYNACWGTPTERLEEITSKGESLTDRWMQERLARREAEARLAEAERLLAAMCDAEANYRHYHDHEGSSSINTGGWWDKMRRRGDMARAFLEGK